MASSSTASHALPDMPPATSARRGRLLTISLAVLGVFVVYVPITSVSVALTTIGAALNATTSDLQWISDSYVIPMAAAVLSAGLFGDIYGRRRVFLTGMGFTLLGSAVAAVAGTLAVSAGLPTLWIGQGLSGLGAGLLLPTTLALIAHAIPDARERGKFIGIWATGLMLGLALGPISSGLILRGAHWGWIYLPTASLALLAGVIAFVLLPESRADHARRLDWPGQAAATITIVASIFGVINGGGHGWQAPLTLVSAIAAVGTIGFVGLVAPHLARSLVGRRHIRVAPVAVLLGALLVCLGDLLGRTVIAPAQLGAGILTAVVGTPYFIWLLLRSPRSTA